MISKRLLLTPRPYSDESLAGYIIRLAESNHYNSPNWILSCAELRSNESIPFPDSERPSPLSQLIEVEDKKLKAMIDTNVIRHGIFYYSIYRYAIKICPKCLKESAYCRAIWDNKLIRVCPFHQCYLITKCPQCNQIIKWARPSVNRCKCSFDFRNSKVTIARSTEILLSLYYYALKGNQICRQKIEKLYGCNHIIFDLDLDDFIKLVKLFSEPILHSIILNYDPLCEQFSRNRSKNYPDFSLNEVVFIFFKNWRDNLKQLLEFYEKEIPLNDFNYNYFEANIVRQIVLPPWEFEKYKPDIINYFKIQNMVDFAIKLCRYFSKSSIFTEYLSVYLINLLARYSISKIQVIYDKKNPAEKVELFKDINLHVIVSKIARKLGFSNMNLAELMESCWTISWKIEKFQNKFPVTTLILKEPLPYEKVKQYFTKINNK